MTPDSEALRALATDHGQGDIFRWWNELGEAEKASLLAQAAETDFSRMKDLIREHVLAPQATVLPDDLQPVDPVPVPVTDADREARRRAIARGEEAIRAGEVAALVVAGGLGTRLGYDAPKGTFPASPITGKPLFRMHAEKILAANRRYGAAIPWYVMTSEDTDAATRASFADQGWFGLREKDVFFFRQASVPAVGLDGKLLMESRSRIATSPNGHGGTIQALRLSGALADLQRRKIRVISYFQVDNALIRVIDPAFIGLHIETGSDFSSKSLPKRDPEEKLGVFCTSGGRSLVVEYSDLDPDRKKAQRPDGRLLYLAGSIAIHALSVDFVERLTQTDPSLPPAEVAKRLDALLPYHRALKKVPCLDANGDPVEARDANGVKFEKFIFDVLPRASNPLVMMVDRAEEFAPIKNKEGEDSPATARQAQVDLFGRWLEEIGIAVPRDGDGHVVGSIEISPLVAASAEELRQHLPPDYRFDGHLKL